MKKTLLTIFCALFGLCAVAQSETNYTEQYVATVNGVAAEPVESQVTVVDNGNGTINFVLRDFILKVGGNDISVGDISLDGVPAEQGEDGLTHFAQESTFTIPQENMPAEFAMYAATGAFNDIPYTLQGKYSDVKLYAVIDIDMSKVDQQINVVVGTDDFFAEPVREGKVYTEPLVVTINEESSEPQTADVTVYENEDGTIDFELKNFILTSSENTIPVGNIVVKNLTTEVGEDGLTHFAFTGNIFIQEGDQEGVDMWYGPYITEKDEEGNEIGIPIVLNGKKNDEKLYVTIDIDMQASLKQTIYVVVGTDDFAREGKVYTEPLVVTINEESSEPQTTDVIVYENENGTIDFELKNFVLTSGESTIPVGNIVVKNITTEVGEDGLTHFSYSEPITIEAGDQEGIDTWYGPLLGNIPVVLNGKKNDEKLYVTIDIDMQASLKQTIYVVVGTDDFFPEPAREGKVYTEPLVVTINEESSEPQTTDVTVYENEDGTIDFELKNFVLTSGESTIPVGNIVVKNITTEEGEDGLTHFAFTGNIFIQEGDQEGVDMWYGPYITEKDEEGNEIGIPIVLNGKKNDEKLYVTIDIDMQASLKQTIYVVVGTDDFFEVVTGDVNGDNTVDVADAQYILNIMADESYEASADVNDDGSVDVADYQFILNIMAEQ